MIDSLSATPSSPWNQENWVEKQWQAGDLKSDFPQAESLKDLFKRITQNIEESGQVVCEFRVNGILLTEDDEEKFATCSVAEIQNISVKSQSPATLLDQSIEGYKNFIAQIIGAIEKSSELFRCDDLHAAHAYHKSCIEASESFIDMMTHYKIAYQTMRGPLPETWRRLEEGMLHSLTQILSAYAKKNYILVADLLEYDLTNIFVSWQNELSRLEQRGRQSESTEGSVRR